MIFKAFALTGRKADCWFTQGECPGLGASAPSGRVGHGLYFLLNYHFPKKHGIFPNNASIFPKKAPIFPKYSSLSGKVWGKACRKMRVFYWLFVNILRFFIVFSLLSEWAICFSQEMPDFSQIRGFFGGVVGKGLFCFFFCSTFAASKKQDNAEMVWCS